MQWFDELNEKQRIVAAKVMDAAQKHGVDPEFALATAMAESKLNPAAVSRDKEGNPIAYGVMQLRPGTAKDLKANHLDEDQNIDAGVRYLKQMVDKTGGDKQLASVAYNAGPNSDFSPLAKCQLRVSNTFSVSTDMAVTPRLLQPPRHWLKLTPSPKTNKAIRCLCLCLQSLWTTPPI